MFELFILSKLLHRQMHGYLIQTVLNSAGGPPVVLAGVSFIP